MIDLKDIKIPVSAIVGAGIGFVIGIIIGIVNGGFIIEVFFRSILSGLILGGAFFGVESLLRNFAPEIFEEIPNNNKRVNMKDSEEEDLSLSDIYLSNNEYPTQEEYSTQEAEQNEDLGYSDNIDYTSTSQKDMEYENEFGTPFNSQELDKSYEEDIESAMRFSEENVLNNVKESSIDDIYESVKEDVEDNTTTSGYSENMNNNFTAIQFSPADLGVTKQSRGGTTQDFIIPEKGKPIPRDYKKLAEAIRTKLKED